MVYPRRGVAALVLGKAGWLFVVAVLVGIGVGIPAVIGLEDGWALSFHGTEVTGQVTDMSITTRSCGKNNHDTCTDYNLAFDYEAGGVMTHGVAIVAASTYRGLTVKGPIRVRYLKSDPGLTEVEFGSTLTSGAGIGLIALIFAGVGLGGLWSGTRAARRMVWLRENGQAQQVRVTAQIDAKTKVNGVRMWRITWADAAGVPGKSRVSRQGDLPGQGDQITIYVDPAGKLASVWEGDCGSRQL